MEHQAPANTTWTAQSVKHLPVDKRLEYCPEFIKLAVGQAQKLLELRRVWILGSRARGDSTLLSDYDLVFDIAKEKENSWASFVGEQRESAKTLLSVDWILYSQLGKQMTDSLKNEGILLYESK